MKSTIAILPLLFCALVSQLHAGANLVQNPGFEDETKGWQLVLPGAAAEKHPSMTVSAEAAHAGAAGLALTCAESVRYAVSPALSFPKPIAPGACYHLSAWVRASDDFVVTQGTPGFYIRVTLQSAPGVDASGGHLYIGLGNKVAGDSKLLTTNDPLPKKWTHVEATFQIPEDAKRMLLNFFVNDGAGTLYIDDVELEALPATTQTTPITK